MSNQKNDRYARLRRIEELDLKNDHVEIAQLFLADFRSVFIGFSYAGFMTTFAAPRMSRILHSTGQITKKFEKRAVDTAIFASELVQNGFGTPKGREIAKAVSAMHARYDIDQEDFIFIACDSAVFAVEMAERFGWRAVTDKERNAVGMFFGRQARAFGGRQPVPKTYAEMRAFLDNCYNTQLWFEPQNAGNGKNSDGLVC